VSPGATAGVLSAADAEADAERARAALAATRAQRLQDKAAKAGTA